MNITLKELYEKIQNFHKHLGYDYSMPVTNFEKMQAIRNIGMAIHQEVAELIDSFPWKPWRPIKSQTFDLDNAKREVVDILFFLVELCEVVDITPLDIEHKFIEVLENNYRRITIGYNNKPEERG